MSEQPNQEATPATARDRDRLAGHHEIGDKTVRLVLVHGRPGRHVEDQVVAGGAVTTSALSATAARRAEVVLVAKVAERRLAGIDPEQDGAAAAAVAAVGSTAGDVRLAPERRRPVTARARTHPDLDAVEKHPVDCRMGSRWCPMGALTRWRRPRGSSAG